MVEKKKEMRFSLSLKLSFYIVSAALVLRIITMVLSTHTTREIVLNLVQEKASNLASATANKIAAELAPVEVAPRNVAAFLETGEYTKDDLLRLIRSSVSTNYHVYGSTVAYEPNAFDPSLVYFAPYFHEVAGPGSEIQSFYLKAPEYDYFSWDWYKIPKQLQKPVWSEPYLDPGVHLLMSTYSVPFYKSVNGKRQFQGVVTADLTMQRLIDIVNEVKLYRSGHAFLLSKSGTFLAHPDPKTVMGESIFSVAGKQADQKLEDVGIQMTQGHTGFASLDRYYRLGKSWIFYAPIETGWSLAVVIPEKELFADLDELTRRYVYISIFMFLVLFVVIVIIARKITIPLESLASTTRDIAKGNLDIAIPSPKTRDEVADLSNAFEDMRVSLKDYIKNLETTTAANSRFESELKIAQNIQMSFLPRTFPPFPDRDEFDLHAFLKPAKEVGGDLYDFFIAENGTLYFLVGDVSDKGVPAALFMAATKTLMRGFSHQGTSPAEVMTRVNRELCLYNDAMMFVTVFCGALNLQTGELIFSNAGHNPPLLVRNGVPRYLHLAPGFVMGVDPLFHYKADTIQLLPSDVLVVYSDGITEAMNSEKKVFSEERLVEIVQKHCTESAAAIVDEIKNSVTAYAAGFPQSDDITVLVFRYNGKGNSA
jgi:sigma-B regulation protein RsbU (phosphoserine phosphatase)